MDNRSDSTKSGDDPFAPGSGGGAVDDLTPPTMKYGPGSLPTQAMPPPTSAGQSSETNPGGERAMDPTMVSPAQANPKARPGRASEAVRVSAGRSGLSPTHIGGGNTATIMGDVATQDLSSEKLLRDAPRLESSGRICPSLNGIPLLAKLGQGGMGAVYYGIHPRLRSEVAVKVLPFHLAAQDPGMIQRFFREAQIAAKVRSPHLVSVIDVNEESGLFFLVMEYVAGITMGQYIKQLAEKGTIGMDEIDAIDVCLAACMGLDAAHQYGIVHRDLKPENIMVPYKSRQHKTFDLKGSKLMDLGLARSEEGNQSLTGVQAAMGTPGYMSPEQALDAKTADKRSDVFGMGATIYALLTGRPPFKGEAVMKVIMATMHEPHEPVTNHRPDISPALVEVIERCLDKRPENRFNDSHQLIRALRNCRKLLAPESVFVEDDRDRDGADPMLTTARIPRTATPGVNPNVRVSTSGQRGVQVAEPKSKLPLIAGVGAAALLAVGATVLMIVKPWDKGPVVDPGKKEVVQQVVIVPLSEAQKKFAIEEHQSAIDQVRGYIRAGKLDVAENKLMRARKADLDVPQLPELVKEWDSVVKEIEMKKTATVFDEYKGKFEVSVASGRLDEAKTILDTLMPADDEQKTLKTGLVEKLRTAETQKKNREELNQLLAEAAKPGGLLPDKLALVERALQKVPDDKIALERRVELQRQIKESTNQSAVKTLYDSALKDYNGGLFDSAADKIAQIKGIDPEYADALKLDAVVQPKLNAEKKEQLEIENKKLGRSAFQAATKFYEENDADNALLKIRTAIGLDPANRQYDGIKTDIEILRADLKNINTVEQKKNQVMETLTEAEKLIAVVDGPANAKGLDDAGMKIDDASKAKLEEATTVFSKIENKNLTKKIAEVRGEIEGVKTRSDSLKQQIEGKRTMLADMKRYDQLVDDATTILADNEKEGDLKQITTALTNVSDALKMVTDGKGVKDRKDAKGLEAKLLRKQSEIQARDNKRKDVQAALGMGNEAVAEGRFADALKSFKEAEEKVKGLSTQEAAGVAMKIDEANKMIAAVGKVDGLVKEENFDQALKALSEIEFTAGSKAIAAKKTEIEASKKALDEVVSKAFSSAAGALKATKIDDAIKELETVANAHKGRADLAGAVSGLKDIKKLSAEITATFDGFYGRYSFVYPKPAVSSRPEVKTIKASLDAVKVLTKETLDKVAAGTPATVSADAQMMTRKWNELSATIRNNLTTIETIVRDAERANTSTRPNTGGNNSGSGNTGRNSAETRPNDL